MSVLRDILDFRLFDLAGTPVSVGTLVTALLIILGSFWVSRLIQLGVTRGLRRRQVNDAGTVGVIRRLLHYAVMLIGIGVAVDTMGINLGTLFAAGAIFAVGIGFAMQNIAQNFVSGVILLLERSIKPGDVLEVEGVVVKVSEMGIRATLARSRDDEDLIIPNSVLVQSTVKNYTLRDSHYRVRAEVGVVYGSDLRQVFSTLSDTAHGLAWRAPEKMPVVLLAQFADSSVNFQVSVWIDDPWTAPRHSSQLRDAIWWALKEVGITIAFPQLDVHFDPPVVNSVERLAG